MTTRVWLVLIGCLRGLGRVWDFESENSTFWFRASAAQLIPLWVRAAAPRQCYFKDQEMCRVQGFGGLGFRV